MESYLKAEISASAVEHNLSLLRGTLRNGTKLCAVVKADCYGHGLDLLLPVLAGEGTLRHDQPVRAAASEGETPSRHEPVRARHGQLVAADCLAVATPEEAINLRRLGYGGPVLMFFSACAYADGHELRDALDELVAQGVTITVVAEPEVESVTQAAERVGVAAQVHVKVDSGMSRSGVSPAAAGALVKRIRRSPRVRLTGMYTHFATADEADKAFAFQQFQTFSQVVASCGGRDGITAHAAASAATIDLQQTHMDMVRPGIALYGYQPSGDMHNRLPLRPALRLTGRLMQIKPLPAGCRCGYGLTHTFARDSRAGLVPVGYGDGYLRSLSGRGWMRVCGQLVPLCGRVSMDQVTIDLTDVPAARVGDEVEIISANPADPHSVEGIARTCETIPYEITCRLGRRVRRVLVP